MPCSEVNLCITEARVCFSEDSGFLSSDCAAEHEVP